MPDRFSRYLLKRISGAFLGGLLFYGGLLLANELIRISKDIFSLGVPYYWVLPLLFGTLPEVLSFVFPMAGILGGLLAAQALANDSELVAAQGLGIGTSNILRGWSLLALMLFILASINANWVVPAASRYQQQVRVRTLEAARARYLRPGGPVRFPPSEPGRALWMAQDGRVHWMEWLPGSVQHLIAEKIQIIQNDRNKENSSIVFKLENLRGGLYQIKEDRVLLLSQADHTLRFDLPSSARLLPSSPLPHLDTSDLLQHPEAKARVEFARRFALPFATAALLLLGLAFGTEHVRFRKGGAIVRSLGVIVLYYVFLKVFEDRVQSGAWIEALPLLLLPFGFLAWGIVLLRRKFRPRKRSIMNFWEPLSRRLRSWKPGFFGGAELAGSEEPDATGFRLPARFTLGRWSAALWFRNWGAVVGAFMALDLVIQFASLGGDLAQNKVSIWIFLQYWAWDLPPFLVVLFPLAFLLGATLALSEAALSQEWTAIRAGGIGLSRWIRSALPAWGFTLAATFALQIWMGPWAFNRADTLYRKILNRPPRVTQVKPWLHLGSTGILWRLDGETRWGFPLVAPGHAPILLRWTSGDDHAEGIPWGGLAMVQGPSTASLFPDESLRISSVAQATPTRDLLHWQRWAPDPERAVLIWERFLGWLAGPVLFFAMAASAFPGPRQGRGGALGSALAAGLAFLGLQALFGGAARAGEIPAAWGVASPLLLMLSFGFLRLRELRN